MGRTRDLANTDGALMASYVFRNLIMNPRFAIAQRGTSIAASTGGRYGLDRWFVDSIGSTVSMAQQEFTVGQTAVPGNPKFFCRVGVSTVPGVANYALFSQRIEGVETGQGGRIRISFWAKADAAKPVSVDVSQIFGTGGSPSAQVNTLAAKINLTTSWQKFSLSVDVPSIAGRTIGTARNDCLQLAFWLDAGSNFNARTATLGQQSITFDIADCQLEIGASESPFEVRPAQVELALCQRYFEIGGNNYAAIATAVNQDFGATYEFKVQKRADPIIVRTPLNYVNCADNTTVVNVFNFYNVVRSAAAGAFHYSYTWTANSEL